MLPNNFRLTNHDPKSKIIIANYFYYDLSGSVSVNEKWPDFFYYYISIW